MNLQNVVEDVVSYSRFSQKNVSYWLHVSHFCGPCKKW